MAIEAMKFALLWMMFSIYSLELIQGMDATDSSTFIGESNNNADQYKEYEKKNYKDAQNFSENKNLMHFHEDDVDIKESSAVIRFCFQIHSLASYTVLFVHWY